MHNTAAVLMTKLLKGCNVSQFLLVPYIRQSPRRPRFIFLIVAHFDHSIPCSSAQFDPFLHNICLIFFSYGPPSGGKKSTPDLSYNYEEGENNKLYLHFIRFVVRSNELQNTKYGRSASVVERSILIHSAYISRELIVMPVRELETSQFRLSSLADRDPSASRTNRYA